MTYTPNLEAMMADAKLCNALMRQNMGVGAQSYVRPKPQHTAMSVQRMVLEAATDTPMTAAQLAERASVSIHGARKAVQRLCMCGHLKQGEAHHVPQTGGKAKTYVRAKKDCPE